MSFDLKIFKGDLQIDKSGSIVTVSGNQKLRQDIIKVLLTAYGDNRYHPGYGSSLGQIEIGSSDPGLTEAEIKNSALSAINGLIAMQRRQSRYQTLSPSETIVSVLDLSVLRDKIDPRLYNLRISVLTQQLTEVFDNITIRLMWGVFMASFRGFSEIVNSMIERLKISQPNLDTKPGSVSRDLFIDLPADQIARFYNVLNVLSQKQSLASSSGQDLDLLASNFGIGRKTGSPASGFIVVCSNNFSADIPIPTGTTATARNGLTFKTLGNYSMSVGDKGRLSANANRLKKALNLAGITANYAIEIPVECSRVGSSGNISSLQIVSLDTNLNGLIVTNLSSFSGGQNREGDDGFRSRILSIFSGANVGTSSGYRSSILSVNGVQDVSIVEPGSSLMLRDGTETISVLDGGTRILNSGNGGKVDIYVLGNKIEPVSESYIFTDLSGTGNIAVSDNDYVLGQQNQDLTRTIEERRLLALKNNNLPLQPATNIISIIGSRSGELVQKYTNQYGEIFGNFELIKDLSDTTGGSPFGYDKIHFISNVKKINGELVTKNLLNSIDSLPYTDIDSINSVYLDVSEVNESSFVNKTNRSIINLIHKPVVRVNRVENITTGEVYVILNQNFDEKTKLNITGQISISGKQLPSPSDVVSVNYIWRKYFNPSVDYAGRRNESVYRTSSSTDVVDWTTSNGIRKEESLLTLSSDGLEYQIEVSNNMTSIASVWTESSETSILSSLIINGESFIGLDLSSFGETINNVISIKRLSDNLELYNTTLNNGRIFGYKVILPTDSMGTLGDSVSVFYNKIELYNFDGTDGSFSNNIITLPTESSRVAEGVDEITRSLYIDQLPVFVSYVSKIDFLISQTNLSNLPIQSLTGENTLVGIGGNINVLRQPIEFLFENSIPTSVFRYGPSQIRFSFSSILNPGKIKIQGSSFNSYMLEISGIHVEGRKVDITNSLSQALSLTSVPLTYSIGRVDKVLYTSAGVTSELDIHGYGLLNNLYDQNRSSKDLLLSSLQFSIPAHNKNPSSVNSGDKITVYCQIINSNEQEDIYARSQGIKITKNTFGIINSISILSGFKNTSGILRGSIEASAFNQPTSLTGYNVDYSFLAPKNGERLEINYNLNRLVLDATEAIESVRPITADILVKEAFSLPVDVTGTILVNDDFITEADSIEQNVITAITGLLNTNSLGSRVDYSDVSSVAAGVRGVDSVNISLFNKTGDLGRKAFIYALENQTIIPGTITINAVSKDKFRIN